MSELLLTKTASRIQHPAAAASGDQVADHLQREAVRRLEIIALLTFATQLVLSVIVNLVQGSLAEEFASPLEWGFPVGVMTASLAMVLIIRSKRVAPATIVRLGLVYQVVICFGIAAGSYVGAFAGVEPNAIQFDRVGLNFVGPWMLIFAVLVPAPPREALVALLASATAVPLAYVAQVPSGLAPALAPGQFGLVFVLPYLVVAGMAYIAARIVHRLGVEVRRAYELGGYRLDALLGQGGMGEVWRASHRTLARPAAIKLVRPESLGGEPGTAAARFELEAQAIASLQSPNTVALYDFGSTDDGTLFYVMELLDGGDLEELVNEHGALPAERVVHILRQACESLAEAHARGIIHRDIKPANIYLCRRALEHDVVKVLDFGLVKHLTANAVEPAVGRTHPDVIAGTPAYLPPELIVGGLVDERADIYALGCVAFWLLTGRLVFDAPTTAGLLVAHAREEPRRPSRLANHPVPEALDQLVIDCLAKDPAARPRSVRTLDERLAAVRLEKAWTPANAAQWWDTNRPSTSPAVVLPTIPDSPTDGKDWPQWSQPLGASRS